MSLCRGKRRAMLGALGGFGVGFFLVLLALPGEERIPDPPLPSLGAEPPSGSFRAELVVPGEAAARDQAPRREQTDVSSAESPPRNGAAREDLAPPLGSVLYGIVTRPDGTPVHEATVSVPERNGSRLLARTDPEGRYTLAPLPPGRYRITAGEGSFGHAEAEVKLPGKTGGEMEFVRRDFVLRPSQRITVRVVTSTGEPTFQSSIACMVMHQAVPVATRGDPGSTLTEVRGSMNARFGIGSFEYSWQEGTESAGGGSVGTLTLHEEPPGWVSFVASHQVLAKQRIDATTEEVTFVIDPETLQTVRCEVRGRILAAETGLPLAGTVSIGPLEKRAEAGAEGTFVIEDAPPGAQEVRIRSPKRATVILTPTLERGGSHDLGDIFLPRAVSLSGTLRTAAGNPAPALLRCGRLDPSSGEVRWLRPVGLGIDPDGTFLIGGLEPGLYVRGGPVPDSSPPRGSPPPLMSHPQRVDATGGSVDGIEVELHATTAITLVAEDVTEPWPLATVRDAAGLPVSSVWPGRYGPETALPLPRGSYTLEIERAGVVRERRPLTVGEGPQRIVLRFD